ncbi:hypothetical protein SAMN05660657_04406 [Geodermatophilus amargosae]|uniref:PASTA domain-containing protein n=1 Tax=Geodermatophilus amargosae TaxID=1296565 RepID=A0A1I7CFG2_9ACTN|nr:PASTA domain-containing protein [Geodermatophilus amargosae]SFT98195.1 hypothetical protein SAMN05660657_04406 [Geodermatophilus amargosae]
MDPPAAVVDPPAAVAGSEVTVSGRCSGESDGVDTSFPGATDLSLAGTVIASDVPVIDEELEQVTVPITAGLADGTYDMASSCGRTTPVTKPFTVLVSPFLSLAPDRVATGEEVTATGTCPVSRVRRSASSVNLALGDDGAFAPATLDGATGVLAPVTVSVPADVSPADYRVISSCGGSAPLTILTRGAPTTEGPPDPLVVVPNLVGLTEQEAVAALHDQLRLAELAGSEERVVRQDPLPGDEVARAPPWLRSWRPHRGLSMGSPFRGGSPWLWPPL